MIPKKIKYNLHYCFWVSPNPSSPDDPNESQKHATHCLAEKIKALTALGVDCLWVKAGKMVLGLDYFI